MSSDAERTPACTIVVFGITGDLAERKLIPALHALDRRGLLDDRTAILGCSRSVTEDDALRERMRDAANGDPAFLRRLHGVRVDLAEPPERALRELARRLHELGDDGNALFHLATPADQFGPAADALGAEGLARGRGWRRLIVEKPFGDDERTARELDARLLRTFDEEQIHRIDHFLGKDAVQNLFVFRAMNAGHESVWNAQHVDHVQITFAEQLGIGTRGDFYEATGVVRDMLQNHLMQLLCLTAMDLPAQLDERSLHENALAVLESLRPPRNEDALVLGQYDAGTIDGEPVRAYRDEEDVDPRSMVPTFVAARFEIDHPRWAGVPFYLRTGKRLECDVGEVVLRFKDACAPFGDGAPCAGNRLVFRIKPDPGIERTFWAKAPGHVDRFEQVEMRYSQTEAFGAEDAPSAYEQLLFDVLSGDRLLFPHAEEIYAAWRAVEPVLAVEGRSSPAAYEAGTWGPAAAHELLAAEGRSWHSGAARAQNRVARALA